MKKESVIKIKRALDEKDSFLNKQLQLAGLYLLSYENIKDRVIGRVKTFYQRGFGGGKAKYSEEYHKRFTGKKPYGKPLHEALEFFAEVKILDENDIKIFKQLKEKRDEIGHRLDGILFDDKVEILKTDELDDLIRFSFKFDNGWIREFESGIAPESYAMFSEEEMAQAHSAMTGV